MRKEGKETEARYWRYLLAEREAVFLYRTLAETDPNPGRARLFRELAEAEERHVAHWATKLGLSSSDLPAFRPPVRLRLISRLGRQFGTRWILPTVSRLEAQEISRYTGDPEAASIMAEEQGHSTTLRDVRDGRYPGSELSTEGWQQAAAGGTIRASVMGANDGLVSIFGLVWGVAGGTGDPRIILLAGVAGLVAGAFSMGAGEYVSMRANRDLAEYRVEMERKELQEKPEEEREELLLIYQLKGLTKEEAEVLADRIMGDPKVALDTMTREELGLDPAQLGSPWGAATGSFASFTFGGIIPLLPYFLGAGKLAFFLSGGFSAIALLTIGAILTHLSRKNAVWGGLRMLLIGMATASVTYIIGRLIGISVS